MELVELDLCSVEDFVKCYEEFLVTCSVARSVTCSADFEALGFGIDSLDSLQFVVAVVSVAVRIAAAVAGSAASFVSAALVGFASCRKEVADYVVDMASALSAAGMASCSHMARQPL